MALPSTKKPNFNLLLAEPEPVRQPGSSSSSNDEDEVSKESFNEFWNKLSKWYKGLSSKKKKTLKPLDLKKRAVLICYQMKIIFWNLPLDWAKNFVKEKGITNFSVDPNKVRKKEPDHLDDTDDDDDDTVNIDDYFGTNSKPDLGNGVKSDDDSDSEPEHAPVSQTAKLSNGVKASSSFSRRRRRRPRFTGANAPIKRVLHSLTENSKDGASAPQCNGDTECSSPLLRRKKKFLDLTKSHVPPPSWVKAFAEGRVLPRMLQVYSTEDTNIIYYDYSPKAIDCFGNKLTLGARPRFEDEAARTLFGKSNN